MASQSIIGEKSLAFAKRIARCYVYLKKKGETVMSKQLLRAGTSIGANNAEACNAISKADFKSKSFPIREITPSDLITIVPSNLFAYTFRCKSV